MRTFLPLFTFAILFIGTIPAYQTAFAGAADRSARTGGDMEFADPASPVVVGPGENFTIILPSNRTTGFTWRLAKPLDEKIIRFLGSDFVEPRSGLDGASGKEVWSFRSVAPGSCIISFEYLRPWEKDRPPAKEARFTLIVK